MQVLEKNSHLKTLLSKLPEEYQSLVEAGLELAYQTGNRDGFKEHIELINTLKKK